MKIFLTGGRGMVGKNVLLHERANRHEFMAPTRDELDLRDGAAVLKVIKAFQPDIIVHAAGKVGGIEANRADPWGFMIENVSIGMNVVSAARQAGVPRLLNLASSCIYPANHSGHLTEEMLLTGELEPTNEAYAIAKIAVLKLCTYARDAISGIEYKSFIPCNIFGPFDNFDPVRAHLLPAIIRKIHEAKTGGENTVEIWGDGTARREFMYAGDLADAIIEGCERYEELPPLMNVGTGVDFSIQEYYEAARRVIGWNGSFQYDLTRPAGMKRKVVDVSRQAEWDWKPCISLDQGIENTYKAFLEGL
ncbi:GDP-L-fucose synthase [Chromobacterium sp. Beijing]|uniref:GDP-L-fucose synthase family protein n=1 Tax=Chromobacterium sp. Beijing TaxID=2735795 RepID=UPI001F403199|nr:GDP-L-fucose synthase [Chromobacterium sp. Beijing]UJB33570.1 GDP-L-fucose synthase [Chromobacterium sp. Beijing]